MLRQSNDRSLPRKLALSSGANVGRWAAYHDHTGRCPITSTPILPQYCMKYWIYRDEMKFYLMLCIFSSYFNITNRILTGYIHFIELAMQL